MTHPAALLAPLLLVGCGSSAPEDSRGGRGDDTAGDCGETSTFYADADGDGKGSPASPREACSAPAGFVANDHDCDDANAGQPDANGVCAEPYETAWGSWMLVINPGTYPMGSGAGDPERAYTDHDVTLTRTFWLGEHELTQREWAGWVDALDPDPAYHSGADLPVESVSWSTVAQYANALSAAEGLPPCFTSSGSGLVAAYEDDPYACPGYRLPTEAEWEYAARAGEDTAWSGSDRVEAVAWTEETAGYASHEVCTLAPNAWGLCDMSGNVAEWTADWFSATYGGYATGNTSTDPAGPDSGSERACRGGSWYTEGSTAWVASRASEHPSYSYRYLGFRLARTATSGR